MSMRQLESSTFKTFCRLGWWVCCWWVTLKEIPYRQGATLHPWCSRNPAKAPSPHQRRLCHGHCAFGSAPSQQTLPSPRKNRGQGPSECHNQPHAYQMAALPVFVREKGSWPSGTEIQINQNLFSTSEVSRRREAGARSGVRAGPGAEEQRRENGARCPQVCRLSFSERSFSQT